LLVVAEGEDGRRRHAEPDDEPAPDVVRRATLGERIVHKGLQGARRVLPTKALGEVDPGESGVEAGAEELVPVGGLRVVRGEEGPHLLQQLVGGDGHRVASGRYFFSSRRASERLWTSSGPSARRSVRTWAHISARGKSWLTPPAPCAWIALSRIHSTVIGVEILIAWISVCAASLPTAPTSHGVLSSGALGCALRPRASAVGS